MPYDCRDQRDIVGVFGRQVLAASSAERWSWIERAFHYWRERGFPYPRLTSQEEATTEQKVKMTPRQ